MSETQDPRVEDACRVMHDAYEAAATQEGWETQERSRKPWEDVPEANKATMRVAVTALFEAFALTTLNPQSAQGETGARWSETSLMRSRLAALAQSPNMSPDERIGACRAEKVLEARYRELEARRLALKEQGS